jgi:hypothetical protein
MPSARIRPNISNDSSRHGGLPLSQMQNRTVSFPRHSSHSPISLRHSASKPKVRVVAIPDGLAFCGNDSIALDISVNVAKHVVTL